jgi:hypothetical protein
MAGEVRLPDIKASVKIDTKGVDAGLDSVQASVKGTKASFDGAGAAADGFGSKATKSLNGIQGAMTSTAGAAALAGAAIAKVSIDAATNLAESQSKVKQVFGESAGEIEKFASTAARNLGMSSQAALEATGTFGNLFRSMGLGLPEATDMSKGLVTLAADLASFNNIDPTVALEKLRSGLVGEIEPLRALGVNFNAAEVEAKAFALGLGDANGKLDDSAKVQARYALILEKTKIAQGDFGRTSDGLANQQRILKAQVADLSAELGNALLPVLTDLAAVIIPVISGVTSLADRFGGLSNIIGNVAKNMSPLLGVLDLLPGKSQKAKDAQDGQKASAVGLKGSTDGLTGAIRGEAEASAAAAKASEDHAKALDKVATATLSTLSSQLGYKASVNTLKDNINDLDDRTREYSEAVEKNGVNSKEAEAANRALRDAHLGIEQSAVAAASAAVKLASDTAEAGGQALSAEEKSAIFKAELIRLAAQADGPSRDAINNLATDIDNIPNRQVQIDVDTSTALAKIASLERRLASISASADSTSGAQQFARGLDVGPVKGPPGAAVPIIAHAGEYVVTPSQLADLRNSPAPGAPVTTSGQATSAPLPPVVHTTIVVDRKVLAEATARGQYEARKR